MTLPLPIDLSTERARGGTTIHVYGPVNDGTLTSGIVHVADSIDALVRWDGDSTRLTGAAVYYRLFCSLDIDYEALNGKMGFRHNKDKKTSVQNDGIHLIVTAPTVGALIETYNWVFDGNGGTL